MADSFLYIARWTIPCVTRIVTDPVSRGKGGGRIAREFRDVRPGRARATRQRRVCGAGMAGCGMLRE